MAASQTVIKHYTRRATRSLPRAAGKLKPAKRVRTSRTRRKK